MTWGTPKEIETRRRIKLAIWAYAYEFHNHSIVPDYIFDVESYQVNSDIKTDRLFMDYWFRTNFYPDSGMWIYKHPELDKIKELYERHYRK